MDVEDAAEITALFNAVSENPAALANLELPHEALVGETPPTPGEGGWQVTGSPAPIERILTKFTREVPGAHIAIEKLNGFPSGVSLLPSDKVVNAILGLSLENFQPEDTVANHITFYVGKAWLKANRIHPWSVQFSRFDDEEGTWVPLRGKLVREDAELIFYTVSPPRFSLWAISGASKVPPIRFRADSLKISRLRADARQDVRIQLQVTNVTTQSRKYNAVLWLNGQVHASKSLTIDNNATETVIFDVRLDPGNYKVRVDKLSGDLTIGSPTPEATPAPKPASTPPLVPTATPAPASTPATKPTSTPALVPTATPALPSTPASGPTPTHVPAPTPSPTAALIPVLMPTATHLPTSIARATTIPPTEAPISATLPESRPTPTPVGQPTATPSPASPVGGGCGAPAYEAKSVYGDWLLLGLAMVGLMLGARTRRS